MPNHLCLSVTFVDPISAFHGRADHAEPEWPPSPLRVFQALVAAGSNEVGGQDGRLTDFEALKWLERLQNDAPPVIVTPKHLVGKAVRIAVPNNDMDSPARFWAKGQEPKKPHRPIDLRPLKTVRPIRLMVDDDDQATVRYYFPLANDQCPHFDVLKSAARSITHLGWGIDMVAADAEVISEADAQQLSGERWQVAQSGGVALRVPKSGTLDDLMRKHEDFLNRLTDEGFKPVPPLREFAVRHYRRSTDPEPRPYCVFTILKPDASGNQAFNTARRTRDVAAWIRHAVAEVCQPAGWPDFLPFVHGHGSDGQPNRSENSSHRFQYLPLPTINSHLHRVESIRRVMVVAPPGCQDRIDFIRRRLLGHALKWRDEEIGVLNVQLGKDWVRDQYTGAATTWTSVTPVILDGYDDRNAAKTEKLLRKALANAGITAEIEELDWQPFGFVAGVEPVRAFVRPEKLHGTMLHVRLQLKRSIPGPLALGAGRYRGYGLMVRDER
ncbi:MAG: type I-U CRISPR-associated protein Csb2 [Pirellulaceae bacterium]